MVKIYCIEDCDGLKYVGSTKNPLSKRLYDHRRQKDCSSKELNLENCIIRVLEECDEDQRNIKEQKWIDRLECVNINNPVANKKETQKIYHKNNLDKRHKYESQWRGYRTSWGGDSRWNNNLLMIDVNIFT